jgi:hypothetical protein
LKHHKSPFSCAKARHWQRRGKNHHLIALFCTVPANQDYTRERLCIFSNEIKDLEATLQANSG